MRRAFFGSLLVFSALIVPRAATAQEEEHESGSATGEPSMVRSAAGVEAYWWSAKKVESALPIIPFFDIQLSPDLVLDFHLPIAAVINAHVNREDKLIFGLGNPTLGLTYVSKSGRVQGFFGGRISAPLASASDEQTWQFANLISSISMALWDVHYWAYKYLPIGLRGGVEYQAKDNIFFRASLEPTLFLPLAQSDSQVFASSRKTELFYQLRLEAEGRSASGWGGGAGLQLVHAITQSTDNGRGDNAQGAFEPFVSYDSSTTFARLGILIALDSPLGLGFDSGLKVAALRLGVGSHF